MRETETHLLSIISAILNHFELAPQSSDKIEKAIEKPKRAIEIAAIPIEIVTNVIEISAHAIEESQRKLRLR